MEERVVQEQTCKRCGSSFLITDYDAAFYAKVEVPFPTHCPNCREQRRLCFHNERKLYRRKCSASGADIISHCSPGVPMPVFSQAIWWGDSWDALEYGQQFDFNRPFFPQFKELFDRVPMVALFTDYLVDENSEFTNYAGYSKNCYLIMHADFNRDCYYGYGVKQCEGCCDVYNVVKCQLCYDCTDCYNCYDLKYGQDCLNCSQSAFLRDCVGCKNCIGCQNLRHKEFCVFNEQLSPAEYEAFRATHPLGSYTTVNELRSQFADFCSRQPQRSLHMLKTENCLGDQLVHCKNVVNSYEISDAEDVKYCTQLKLGSKDCMDVHQFGTNAELLYECVICGQSAQRLRFCSGCYEGSSELTYCSGCYGSKRSFGCVNTRRKEYCIFNVQYSKDEYFSLESRIIEHMKKTGEWGEFFPAYISPFGYNESRAIEFFPLTKDEALREGFNWRDEESVPSANSNKYQIPDEIRYVRDDAAGKIFECEVTGKPFKITAQELNFYKENSVPLPRRHPDQRFKDRMNLKNPRGIWIRMCSKCSTQMHTTWPPESAAIVYCEACYESCF